MHSTFAIWWRMHMGLSPLQFCMVCGKPYWGGLPRFWYFKKKGDPDDWWYCPGEFQWTWLPWWCDYCSKKCNDEELEFLAEMTHVKEKP